MDSTTVLDEIHQKVMSSFNRVKKHPSTFGKLQKAAVAWQAKLAEASAAELQFFAALEEIGSQAHDAPGMAEIGRGFNNLTDCSRGLVELQREVQRSLADEIIIPLSSRIEVDHRHIVRMEKDYLKFCTEQVERIAKAEKEVSKVEKAVRKSGMDAELAQQKEYAQRVVISQVQELDALRTHTLKTVLTEERSKYCRAMIAVLDALKTEFNYFQRSMPAIDAVIRYCDPICYQPNKLPPGFAPLAKRGGPVRNGSVVPPQQMEHMNGVMSPRGNRIPGPGGPVGYPTGPTISPPPPSPLQQPMAYPHPVANFPGESRGSQSHIQYTSVQPPTKAILERGPPLGPDQYRAKYPFHAQDEGQLSFGPGEVILVDGDPEDNWQYGTSTRTGKSGWFPVNYLQRKTAEDVATLSSVQTNPPPVDYNSAPHHRHHGGGDQGTVHFSSPPPPPPPMPAFSPVAAAQAANGQFRSGPSIRGDPAQVFDGR